MSSRSSKRKTKRRVADLGELVSGPDLDRELARLEGPLPGDVDAALPLAAPPVLPDLSAHVPEFHTPPGRQGLICTVSFALLPGVVLRRVFDQSDGSTCHTLAGLADLDDVQHTEPTSRAWYPVTDQQHAALAALEGDAS